MNLAIHGYSYATARIARGNDVWHLPYVVRRGNSMRAHVLVTGFAQPMGSWIRFAVDVFGDTDDTIVILGRRFGNEASDHHTGWMLLSTQIEEVHQALHELCHNGPLIGIHDISLIGHSVGGLIVREVMEWHAPRISTLVQIAPIVPYAHRLLFNKSFWTNGGLKAVIPSVFGLLPGRRGFTPPKSVARGLFTGYEIDEATLETYAKGLVPDSTIVFLELLLTYDGQERWTQIVQNWHGRHVIVACDRDPIVKAQDLVRMFNDLEQRGKRSRGTDEFVMFGNTPHCPQFAGWEDWRVNVQKLRSALKCKPAAMGRTRAAV